MGRRVIKDVTGKLHDMDVLRQLYNLCKQYSNILETTYYLEDFSRLETFETFNPKYIIRDTLAIYMRSVMDIRLQPRLLQTIVFKFHEAGNVRKFEFSNNMMWNEDITILCFLYHISYKPDYDQCETVQVLKSLMLNKYGICIERRADDTEPTQEQNKITLHDIAFSFPSVTWDMARNIGLYTILFDKFSDFDLPKMIFLPRFFSLLPELKERPPLAILFVIALRTDDFNRPETYERLSLRAICNDISNSLSHKIFPERLKLELCKMWQIVMTENCAYKYTPCFTTHRQKAKDEIAKMKSDDPDLELILSGL